jgi:signal transduction histidine kinase
MTWNQGEAGRWLVPLLLLLGVLAPCACLLWFLNVAVENQRAASQRKLAEAYRGQLILLRARADSYWEQRTKDLARQADQAPGGFQQAPAAFQQIVEKGLADAVAVLNPDGSPAYPAAPPPVAADPVYNRPDWLTARALENASDFAGAAAAYASIVKEDHDVSVAARDKSAALRAIDSYFTSGRLMRATDLAGRLIAADEQLLAVRLSGPRSVFRLDNLLNDYKSAPIPASQRLFLMQELPISFPTQAAERLAAQFLETGNAHVGESILEPAGLADVWKLTAPGGRAIALYRSRSVVTAIRALANGMDSTLSITPPDVPFTATGEWISAGPRLPGWQLSLSPPAEGLLFNQLLRQQRMSYIWLAILAIAVVALTSLTAAGAFRRHWRLARLKTDLVAAVSHELKTPLASMRLLVDALLEDGSPDAQKTHEYLELIARENGRLSRLIENFLTFSRLERNRHQFAFTLTRPERVIDAVLAAVGFVQQDAERFDGPDCRLEVNIDRGLPDLLADEDAVVTVLLNLLDNACKYTPGEKRIGLRAYASNGSVVFAVSDNGIGIPPREQKRVSRRFYQVDRRLARASGGCGLGLTIVESIVRAHRGSVHVESEPGRGSTFSVVLPCADGEKGAAA